MKPRLHNCKSSHLHRGCFHGRFPVARRAKARACGREGAKPLRVTGAWAGTSETSETTGRCLGWCFALGKDLCALHWTMARRESNCFALVNGMARQQMLRTGQWHGAQARLLPHPGGLGGPGGLGPPTFQWNPSRAACPLEAAPTAGGPPAPRRPPTIHQPSARIGGRVRGRFVFSHARRSHPRRECQRANNRRERKMD